MREEITFGEMQRHPMIMKSISLLERKLIQIHIKRASSLPADIRVLSRAIPPSVGW